MDSAFFTVLGSTDLWKELRKHMFPNKKSSSIINYSNGDIAVYYGYLSLIKENPCLIFTEEAIINAIIQCNLQMLTYLHEYRKLPYLSSHIKTAAECGTIEIFDEIFRNVEIGYTKDLEVALITIVESRELCFFTYLFNFGFDCSIYVIIMNNRVDILSFLHDQGCVFPNFIIDKAAEYNKLECIKYLHSIGCSHTTHAMNVAAVNGNLNIIKFLHELPTSQRIGYTTEGIDGAIFAEHNHIIDYLQTNNKDQQVYCSGRALERAVVLKNITLVEILSSLSTKENIAKAIKLAKLHNRKSITFFLENYLSRM